MIVSSHVQFSYSRFMIGWLVADSCTNSVADRVEPESIRFELQFNHRTNLRLRLPTGHVSRKVRCGLIKKS